MLGIGIIFQPLTARCCPATYHTHCCLSPHSLIEYALGYAGDFKCIYGSHLYSLSSPTVNFVGNSLAHSGQCRRNSPLIVI